ncbi:NAD(P)-binding protein [Paramyrothecium foliicola]|nr:NAD(P)-binding protein [Paramyrothecium foliicola]
MGTIILTGANSSLGIHAVEHLFATSPESTAILTVRNETDINTQRLRAIIAKYKEAKAQIRILDLANLKLPPIKAIICNAHHWNLNKPAELTGDGLEKTLVVNFVANVALVLSLLKSIDTGSGTGRVVFLGGACHDPGKNNLEKYPPSIPANLDEFAKLHGKYDADKQGWGFWRYAESKLLITAFMHALNRELEKNPQLSSITAVAINPGDLLDSRVLQTNTPLVLRVMQRVVLQPLGPVLKHVNPTLRTSTAAGIDVMKLALSSVHPGERGYFTLLEKESSSAESLNVAKQAQVWNKGLESAGVSIEEAGLTTVFSVTIPVLVPSLESYLGNHLTAPYNRGQDKSNLPCLAPVLLPASSGRQLQSTFTTPSIKVSLYITTVYTLLTGQYRVLKASIDDKGIGVAARQKEIVGQHVARKTIFPNFMATLHGDMVKAVEQSGGRLRSILRDIITSFENDVNMTAQAGTDINSALSKNQESRKQLEEFGTKMDELRQKLEKAVDSIGNV